MTLFVFLVALLACHGSGLDPNQPACTELAAVSVMLAVVGPDGEPIVAEVTAVDEEGNEVVATCADGTSESCTEWIVGYEVAGAITISGSAPVDCNTATGEVVVDVPMDEDGCHVVGQVATLELTDVTDLGCEG